MARRAPQRSVGADIPYADIFLRHQSPPLRCRASIGPKIGIDFRKARCVDSKTYSVLWRLSEGAAL
ncbi:hypothetical protein FKV68_06715 [Sinorhizobium mexicanum]|uniref:Uncharacterized protein n=1 Tax=Sinorhizobium mexicanum TaxID=375549 RepID=A0A859QJ97_9HYPH|nr:hypothetical protein FKV68_06715 [Sinorhizobium mexicanum]